MNRIQLTDTAGKHILVRTDLNLPIEDGDPQPTLRFQRYAESLQHLSDAGAKTVVMAHQGRPGRDDFTSLEKHVSLLQDEIDASITFTPCFFGTAFSQAVNDMDDGDILVLENIRFLSEELEVMTAEEHANDIFVRHLAPFFDMYINDAFSAAHRAHASLMGFPPLLPAYAGPVMAQEYDSCRKVRDEIDNPVLVIGGEKPADIISILENMLPRCKYVLLGGVPGEIALRLTGHSLGAKDDWLDKHVPEADRDAMQQLLDRYSDTILLPTDLVTDDGTHSVDSIPDDQHTWDIGPETRATYTKIISEASTAVLKGPMGAFDRGFGDGSKAVVDALADSTGFTVISGGHSSSLVERFGHALDDFSHVSIAGGAFVRFMSGEDLPAIQALDRYSDS